MKKVTDALSTVKLGEPQTYENLTIYPLHLKNGHQRSYQTLNEAMESKQVTIKEISEGGSVPELVVSNTGELPVLIVVGEELIGAKQNRVLNTSLLVPAKSDLQVPVSCVEQGRWSYNSRDFHTSSHFGHYELRKTQTRNVTENLRTRQLHDASQGEVWQEVRRKISSHGSSSVTSALHDVYDQTEGNLKGYLEGLKAPESEGILVVINGQVVGGDLFDHHETMRKLWDKLLRSYALDALERKSKTTDTMTSDDPEKFVTSTHSVTEEIYDAVGLGKDVRLTGERMTGSSLVWEDHLIHTSLFNTV